MENICTSLENPGLSLSYVCPGNARTGPASVGRKSRAWNVLQWKCCFYLLWVNACTCTSLCVQLALHIRTGPLHLKSHWLSVSEITTKHLHIHIHTPRDHSVVVLKNFNSIPSSPTKQENLCSVE